MSERLTWRNEQGVATFKRPVLCERCDEPTWSICDESGENITERMCDLEDLLCDESGEEAISLEKLREIAEAEREGRVIVLPVKQGSRFYAADAEFGKIIEQDFDEYEVTLLDNKGWGYSAFCRGKASRIFKTKSEAVAALAEKGE